VALGSAPDVPSRANATFTGRVALGAGRISPSRTKKHGAKDVQFGFWGKFMNIVPK